MVRILSAIAAAVFLTACDMTGDDHHRLEGAGLALHSGQTDRNTESINRYFAALCNQAGYGTGNCAPVPGAHQQGVWRLLVQTGYNDIDYRCDRYLSWIDSKRSERILFDGTTNALGSLTAGLLKGSSASASTLADIALVLGFTRDVYDSYQSSLLLGLEGSTIKEIVNKRRSTHRMTFQNAVYDDRAEAIFALRRYLTFCTPQSILTDVNSFSRGAASGILPPIAEDAAAAASVITPTSVSPVTPTRRDIKAVPSVPSIADFVPFSTEDVERIQAAACIEVDGDVGPQTRQAVAMLHDNREGFDDDPLISSSEWMAIQESLNVCDTDKFKNIYENVSQSDNDGISVVNSLANSPALPRTLLGKPLNDPEVRAALAAKRKELGLAEPEYGLSATSDQLTPKLYTVLSNL